MNLRKVIKFFLISIGAFALLVAVWTVLISSPKVQTYLTQQVTKVLSKKLNTEIGIEQVKIEFFSNIVFKHLFIQDQQGETMIYAERLKAELGLISLLQKKIRVKQLELTNPSVYFKREAGSEGWNHDFLFKGSKEPGKKKQDTTAFAWDILVNELVMKDANFTQIDDAKAAEISMNLPHGIFQFEDIGLQSSKLDIRSAKLENAVVFMQDLPLDSSAMIPDREKDGRILKGKFQIAYQDVELLSSIFKYRNRTKESTAGGIDFSDLDIQDINLNVSEGSIIYDTIRGNIQHLSCHDKSGFAITELKTDAVVSTVGIECKDLKLVTPNSKIEHYLAFDYRSFKDFNDFEEKVKMRGEFEDTRLSFKDINYFAKTLDKVAHNTIAINGSVRGSIDNLKGRQLDVSIGNSSRFVGNFTLQGLPNFKETFINLKVEELVTNYLDIRKIYPHIVYPDNLANLGRIRFSGRFDGFTNDFVTEGRFLTAIGSISSDINLKLKEGKDKARYSGNLALSKFNLGKFLNDEQTLGLVSLNTNVSGGGLTLESMNATLKGNVDQIFIKDYEYSDITLDGTFQQEQFNGLASMRDENLEFDFKGLIDLNKEVPEFQFESTVKKANLKKLNLTKNEYVVESKFNLNLAGANLDQFEGFVGMYQTSFETNGKTYKIDTLQLSTNQLSADEKQLELTSDIASARIKGRYSLREFGAAFKHYLDQYFDIGLEDTSRPKSVQDFEFEAEIKNSDNLTELLHPNLHSIKNLSAKGRFNSNTDVMQVDASIGYIGYQKYKFRNLRIKSASTTNQLEASTSIKTIHQKRNLVAENLDFLVSIDNQVVDFNLIAQGDTIANQLNISGLMAGNFEEVSLQLDPSSIALNDKIWSFTRDNLIKISKRYLVTENLQLRHRDEVISFKSTQDGSATNLGLSLNNIDLANFSNLIKLSGNVISGTANGDVNIDDVFDNTTISANLSIDQLKINKDSIGLLQIRSDLDNINKRIVLNGLIEGPRHHVEATGYYSYDKNKKDLNVAVDVDFFELSILGDHLDKYAKYPTGNAYGKLTVTGTTEQPLLTGSLTLDSTYATVPVLETRYFLENETFVFNEDHIAFNNIVFRDADRNTAIGNGRINHFHLKDFSLDLALETDKFQFLNTTIEDNKSFYGVAYADGNVTFKGPFNDVTIYANATTKENTRIFLPLSEERDVGDYSFYRFINAKIDTLEAEDDRKINDFHLTLDINVTPEAEGNLIFDLEARDIIKGRGFGSMKIKWDRYGDFNIYGTYNISEGDYLFTLRNIINKNFTIKKGGSVIWTGDPYEAILNIKAIYSRRVSPYDLIEEYLIETADDQLLAKAKKTEVTELNLILTGSLSQPDVRFDIDILNPDPSIRNYIDSKLQLVESDENELNKQVLGIMVLNRFLPSGTAASNPQLLGSVTTTVSEFISTQLSIYLTDAIGIFDPNLSLNVNYSSYEAGADQIDDPDALATTRRELTVALTRRFFNDRFSVTAGGNFDFGEYNQDIDRNTGIAGDVQVEYDLTPDGRVRIKAFSESEYDVFDEANEGKAGFGISYNQEFNNLPELFDQIRKRKAIRRENRKKKKLDKEQRKSEQVAEVD